MKNTKNMCKTWTGSQSRVDCSSATAFPVVLVPSQENAPPTITRGQTENGRTCSSIKVYYCDRVYTVQVIAR